MTLPSAHPDLAPHRTIGRVFIGGPDDVPVVQRLVQIFPGLNVWAAAPIALGPTGTDAAMPPIAVLQRRTEIFRQQLAASVLAIDFGGCVPDLASEAAELGVPCIGPARSTDQVRLWPELSLGRNDVDAAVMLGRLMLIDQGKAGALCAAAHRALSLAMPDSPPHAAEAWIKSDVSGGSVSAPSKEV